MWRLVTGPNCSPNIIRAIDTPAAIGPLLAAHKTHR